MASIADLFFQFRGDDSQLQVDASKAGDKAGQTLGQRLSAGAKVGLVGLGAGAGALFGIASKGGAQLTEAVAAYRAETGATAEEAEIAQASIGKLYRNNVAGFEALGAVLAAVKTNLGLTGAEGEKAAQRILDFAKVTGQDAVVATGQLDDIMDSLNLNYEQGSAVLDQLVASQQKFGGSVDGNAAALAALAPALNAANLSVDDGIGLLNLFAASGIDAADAPAALTKALTKVESPAELQMLIDDINATQDPFERAEKAAELFGKKAGAKLANALDGVDFQTFVIGATEAGGAIDEASRVIDEAPLNRLKLALKGVAGPLADVGTKFGPLVLGFTQLGGGKLITGVTTSLGALAGKLIPKLLMQIGLMAPAAAIGGTATGATIAGAMPIGMALLPALLIAALVAAIAFLIANPEITAKIAAFAGDLITNLIDFLLDLPGKLLDLFTVGFNAVAAALPGFIGQVVGFILSIPGKVLGLQAKLLGFFGGIGAKILAGIGTLVGEVVKFYLSIPGKIVALAGELATFFSGVAARISSRVGTFVGEVVRFFLSIPGRIASLGGEIVKGIIGGMASLPGKLADTIRKAFLSIFPINIGPFHITSSGIRIDPIKLDVPGFATGSPFVPRDMLAMVHEGEIIIPAAESEAIRAGRANLGERVQAGDVTKVTNYNLTVQGDLRAKSEDDVVLTLQRIASFAR
ncbi:MAG: phage tail tape measure protein [Chloroflexota bacterium]